MFLLIVQMLQREVDCGACECYETKCSRLEFPGQHCKNSFQQSCDNKVDVVPNRKCTRQCDCCLDSHCVPWTNPSCILYRTFYFHNVFYFVMVLLNIFICSKIYN